MSFEDFEPIFGEARAEWLTPTSTPLRQFLFHFHALDSCRLRFHVTDFFSSTWEAVRSVQHLEDLRDNIGIGGSWSEFVDYLITSIKSGDVKLVLEGSENAKLFAQKLKGMPLISFPLGKLVDVAASKAMADLSLELHRAYKSNQKLLINEQEGRYQLTRMISAEQEKNENIQRQLDALLFPKRQKPLKMNDKLASDTSLASTTHDTTAAAKLSSKLVNRAVPAYRRAKVRGVLLQDTEDEADS